MQPLKLKSKSTMEKWFCIVGLCRLKMQSLLILTVVTVGCWDSVKSGLWPSCLFLLLFYARSQDGATSKFNPYGPAEPIGCRTDVPLAYLTRPRMCWGLFFLLRSFLSSDDILSAVSYSRRFSRFGCLGKIKSLFPVFVGRLFFHVFSPESRVS